MKRFKNMLASTVGSFVSLDSTNGTEAKSGFTIENKRAKSGRLYIQCSDFSTPTGGLTLNLYDSFGNGDSWFLNTTVSAYDTATNRAKTIDYLGGYLKLGYNVEAVSVNNLRVTLELNEED